MTHLLIIGEREKPFRLRNIQKNIKHLSEQRSQGVNEVGN